MPRFFPLNNAFSFATAVVLISVLLVPVYAQDPTGDIRGVVADSTGAVMPGVMVVVTNLDTGVKRMLVTNETGVYSAPKLQAGNYKVEAEQPGFKKYDRSGIVIGAGSSVEISIVMEVGAPSDTVWVTEAAPMVATTSGAQRTSISLDFIDRLPIAGRDSLELVKLTPGAVIGNSGGFTASYHINGTRDTSNSYTLDGTDATDTWNSAANKLPPPDSLREFTVQSNYSAEFGHGGGAAVVALSKSGTNTLHGSVYDYFRSENLDANSFQRNASGLGKGDLKRHQLGFTVGGPILLPKIYDGRNRSFFFLGYQALQTPATAYLVGRGGLTAAELAGDFSNSKIIPTVTSAGSTDIKSPFPGMVGQKVTNLKPWLSKTAVRWYNFYEMPIVQNSGDRSFESATQNLNLPEWTMRFDHSIRQKNTLSFSAYYRNDAPDMQEISYAPKGYKVIDTYKSQHYTFSDAWIISPTMVNDISIGYNRIWSDRFAQWGKSDWNALGFPWPQPNPYQFIQIGTLSPSFFNFDGRNRKYEGRDVLDFRETFSFNRGNHFMKGGAMVQIQKTSASLADHNEFSYGGGRLTNGAAEFLIGWPGSMNYASELFYRPSLKNVMGFFFQDDWKLTRNLTLNLGLRYEPNLWAYIRDGHMLIFIPDVTSKEFSNFPSGVITVTDPQSPNRAGRVNDMNNVAPRVGFAYRLDSTGKKVIRGGWGIFYDTTDANRDGVASVSAFPFIHRWGVSFNRGYPGPDGWLDIFAYQGMPIPNMQVPIDPGTATFDPTGSYGSYLPDGTLGYVHQWNLTWEHEFRPGWAYSAAYVGNLGVDLWGYRYWNVPVSKDDTDNSTRDNMASRRPIQKYRYITKTYQAASTSTSYHAAQFVLKTQSKYFNMLAHYTRSRAFGDIDGIWGSDFGRSRPDDPNPYDWSRTKYDRPHLVLIMPSWDLPLLRGRDDLLGKVIGGWNTTLVISAQSGQPVNIRAAQNNTFTCSGCEVRPNATGQPFYVNDWRKSPGLVYLNAGAFSQPPNRTYGGLERNAVTWPATKKVDMSLSKKFALYGERVGLELRFDIFNVFNWVNWNAPSASISLSNPFNLGMQAYWTQPPRQMQVGGRLSW